MTLKDLGQSMLPSSTCVFLLSSRVFKISIKEGQQVFLVNRLLSSIWKFSFYKYFSIGTLMLQYFLKLSTGRTWAQWNRLTWWTDVCDFGWLLLSVALCCLADGIIKPYVSLVRAMRAPCGKNISPVLRKHTAHWDAPKEINNKL